MILKKSWARLLSLVMAIAVLSSALSVSALAAPADAKNDLAAVAIRQTCNGKAGDNARHDYRTDGEEVDITYSAKLNMTENMAIYLQARQNNLMRASFMVHVNMDLDLLEFHTDKSSVKVAFSSTFLKPAALNKPGYSFRLTSYQDGIYTYEITVPASWAKNEKMDIPMELITYFDGREAYGYEESKAFPDQPLMYHDFSVEDWMKDITLNLADMKVKDSVAETVTTASSTWKTVAASGTVEGSFAYISDPAESIQDLITHEEQGHVNELVFGDGEEITGWTSNTVQTKLVRTQPGGGNGGGMGGGSETLNTKDHYSYIIGYKDGTLRPYGTITRGEVATIFFRLLTDEARNKYWCQSNDYTDVPLELWCNNAISTLSNMGIIDGFRDGSFQPYGKITRAQFAKIAVGFFETTAKEYEGYFTDVSADAWYSSYVEAASRVGLIKGFEDGSFRPNTNITRAQACVIVNRALDRHPEEDHLLPSRQMLVWPDNNPGDWFYADMQEATNSHDYVWVDTKDVDENGEKIRIEDWTKKLEQRDWAALEHAWSNAHSAQGGGDVVKD